MAFQGMFGAGVNGLFSGMSDAMKLYAMYQGIEQTQAGIDNADAVKKAMQDDAANQQPAGSAKDNIWGGGVNPNDTNDPGSNIDKPDPDAGTAKPSEGIKVLAGAVAGAGGDKSKKPLDTIGPAPGVTPETKSDTGAALTPNAPITSPSPAAGAAAASGLQTPAPTPPPEEQGPPASAIGQPPTQQAAAQPAQQPLTPGQRAGTQPLPIGRPNPLGVTVNPAGTNRAVSTDVPGVTAAPGQNVPPTLMPTSDLPPGTGPDGQPVTTGAVAGPAVPPTPQQPPNYDPANQSGFRSRRGGAIGQRPAQPTIAPGATETPQQTSDAGQSIGSRILGAFIPSAQAAEPVPGQGQGPGQGQPQPSVTPAATDNGPAAPAPAAQPQGAVGGQPPTVQAKPAPATSPVAQQPAQQQTGPAKTNAPVAPDQQGQTATSEAPPKVQRPEFDHRPYMLLQRDHPDEYALVNKIAGEEHTSPAQLALLWHLESNMQPTSINSAKGAVGPLQILPSTARMVDPKGEEDITTLKGGLTIAARIQHMIIEPKFGVGTPSSFIAYQGGNGSADDAAKMSWAEFQASHKDGAKYLTDAYGTQPLAQGMFTPDGSVNMKQFVDAGIQQGPNGALDALVRTGPAGMSMSNLWKQAEISGVYAALMKGDQQGAMAARDFVFQMSHAGATSNLMAADQQIVAGNGAGALPYLAKAHAFFPDGTYGQFGVDKAGQVWGQRFDETTGKPLAQPFQVTHEGLATQLIETRDPNKYRELVNKEQQNAADLRLKAAHESYYYEAPTARSQAAALASSTKMQIEHDKEQARWTNAEADRRSREGIAATRADNTAKHEQGVEKEAHDLYTPDSSGTYRGLSDMGAADAAPVAGHIGEIYTAVRNSEQPNGGHLSSPFAQTLAKTIAKGPEGGITFDHKTNPTTGESVVEMSDKAGNKVGYLSPAQAQRLMGLGLIKVPQSQAPQAPGQGAGQRAAIGGGAGSYQVAASGGGTNLANQPYQMPQPAQAIG